MCGCAPGLAKNFFTVISLYQKNGSELWPRKLEVTHMHLIKNMTTVSPGKNILQVLARFVH